MGRTLGEYGPLIKLAVAYYLAAIAGLLLLSQTNNIAIVWPASAFLIAYLLRREPAQWPVPLAVCFFSGALADYTISSELPINVLFALPFADIFADALIAAFLLRRFGDIDHLFSSVREVAKFILLACILPPAIGGLIGGGVVAFEFGMPFWPEWFTWWRSTSISVALLVPLLYLFSADRMRRELFQTQGKEAVALLATTAGFGAALLISPFQGLLFLVIPLFLWAALRFGVIGLSLIATCVATTMVVMTATGAGPVVQLYEDITENIEFLQFFLMASYLPTLFCAAALFERSAAENTVRQAQKMDAVGQLSGGIAHDFNNILGVIRGNLELLQRRAEDDDETSRRVGTALRSVERGANLSGKLLRISKSGPTGSDILNVNTLVADLKTLLSQSFTASVDLRLHLAEDLWLVEVDAHEFEDAVLNLALNARDAIKGDGLLVIETANKSLDGDYARLNPGSRAGEFVMITFSDNGVGMTKEVKDKAFEPFYSTKEKGSGLGLAMVYGFAQRAGGHVKIYSEPNVGTTVHIYLPKARSQRLITAQEPLPQRGLPGGTETILVVDDEPELVEVAATTLRTLGYTVFEATTVQQALDIVHQRDDLDLLFSDVIMPGKMDGYALALELKRLKPLIRVLMTSGFTQKREEYVNGEEIFVSRLASKILSKPYSRQELADAVRRTLDVTEET